MRGRTDKRKPAQPRSREQQKPMQPRPAQADALSKLLAVVIGAGGRNEPAKHK